jgi:hypothetical protein
MPRAAIHLVDVSEEAGLDFMMISGRPDKYQIYEANTGGLAWLDYDRDGRLDLYLVNGSHRLTATAPPDREATSAALYRNQGDGTFRDVTHEAGLWDWRWGMAAAVGDYDNDGDPDLYATHLTVNALWRNNGDGTFTDVAAEAGVDDDGPGSGAAFGDVDADGFLDLYVANYSMLDPESPIPVVEELCVYRDVPVYCGPKGLSPAPDRLFRNRGDGTFEEISELSGIAGVSPRFSFDVLFLDLEGDGDQDIYVAADATPSLLFINDGAGRFTEQGLMAGVALSEAGIAQAGMGLDAADYDGDGLQDIVKTNFETETFNLYQNSRAGLLADRSFHTGLAASARPLGFGTLFFDVNRDGVLDLFFANGHVYSWYGPEPGPFEYPQRNLLYLGERANGGIQFHDISSEAGPGLAVRKVSRGLAAGDYDADGDLDLVITNMDSTPTLLRNDSLPAGGWLAVRVEGTVSNRDGYGAQVLLEAGGSRQVREVRASRGYLSSSDPAVFFGLGAAKAVHRLEIRWPNGRKETFTVDGVDRLLVAREGEGTLLP